MTERRDACWFRRCRFAGEIVELLPGEPRQLCAHHVDALERALAAPETYRIHWGRAPRERIRDLEAMLADASQELEGMGTPEEDDDDPDSARNLAIRRVSDLEDELARLELLPGHPVVNIAVRTR